ncbi:polysaccharide biosynthesis protein [Polynucleobacter paneuropaeus]|jgi:FlaA1/EpsC-like NDP-sugar epimerase|nr:polysaccharide biosynthesis protein [Polynucleobacter paneuropaeus]
MLLSKLTIPVLGLPRFIKRCIVLFIDIGLCILATSISFYLRLGAWIPFLSSDEWSPLLAAQISVALGLPIFILFGLYREVFRHSGWMALLSLTRAISLYAVVYALLFSFIGMAGVPRTIGLLQPIVLLILVGASRGFASYWLGNAYRRELRLSNLPRVLIYGAGNAGRQLAGALSHSYEMKVVGFLDDDKSKQGQNLVGRRVYDPSRLLNLVLDLKVNSVLLAIPSANRHRRNEILKAVRDAKVSIQTLPSMSDLAQGKIGTQDLRSLDIDDLLGRELVLPDSDLLTKNSFQKSVMITGAGGSIGSELCRQVLDLSPKTLVLVDQSEFCLYQIHQELNNRLLHLDSVGIEIVPLLASVVNVDRMFAIIKQYRPDIIYHAAAYKHVPLVESNVVEGVRNNVIGTLTVAKIAQDLGVPNFILISTDKAVRPTNVMGASKRVSELVLQALASTTSQTCFAMVRFGNVLNSSGSVVPKFRQQIKDGGPVTITDFRITRFFMTIPEAAQLVIQAGAMAKGGDVFLLDMGEPVKILDLACRMIELSGLDVRSDLNPNGDIEIEEIGLRPGEKLYEELLIEGSPGETVHPRIFKSHEEYVTWDTLKQKIIKIEYAISMNDQGAIIELLKELVAGYCTREREGF